MTAPQRVVTASEMAALVRLWKHDGHTVALVPTMGALHEGHLALVKRAADIADRVVVSIFVNPLQFAAGEDFDRYPRSVDDDIDTLKNTPVHAVFTPEVTDVYPDWPTTTPTVFAGAVGDTFEGAARPGHFDGVLTVVSRLCDLVNCDVAVFGQKDAQQAFLVRRLGKTRTPPITMDVVPTIRDESGLALSSRNRYLDASARQSALALPRALSEVAEVLTGPSPRIESGDIEAALESARDTLISEEVTADYLEVVDDETFLPWRGEPDTRRVVIIGACLVSGVRLLDAMAVTLPRGDGH